MITEHQQCPHSQCLHSQCLEQCVSRNDFGNLLNSLGLTGEGVEIGVCEGEYSETLLATWTGSKLHLVDPWRELSGYRDITNAPTPVCEARFHKTISRLQPFSGRFQIHRQLSSEAVDAFGPGTLDFVYIDGNHDYQHVSEDIRLWHPKLRKGGLLAGHDYCDEVNQHYDCGVQSAVTDFLKDKDFILHLTKESIISWFFLV